jgi:UDP-N-acetylglucosamine acyltransferase
VPFPTPQAIERLRYRYPSALVDAVLDYVPGEKLSAVKNVSVSEDFFQGHFPGTPLLPAVLMIETFAQVATMLVVGTAPAPAVHVCLRGVDNAKFRRQVVPGDRLRLDVTLGRRRGPIVRAHATAYVEEAVVAEAELVMSALAAAREAASPGIHETAIVHPSAQIGAGTVIGPYAIVGERVKIGPNCRIGASAVIDGDTEIGEGTEIFPFASIGLIPQDLKYRGEPARVVIGAHNVIREFVTIHRGTAGGGGVTRIGDRNLLMAYTHIAHDCQVGNETIFGNGATLAGHVFVDDYANVGAFSGVHQFCRVGRHAFIGGYSVVTKDALPFAKTVGNRARIYGINTIGLMRRGFSTESVAKLRRAFRYLVHSNTSRAIAQIEREPSLRTEEVRYLVEFIRTSSRGVGLRRPSRRLEQVVEE